VVRRSRRIRGAGHQGPARRHSQTLPDGQGQLTNLELGDVDRIEVLRGSASALHGNASGGVISIWTNRQPVERLRANIRFIAGRFDRRSGRTWSKWLSTAGVRRRGQRAAHRVTAGL
jgi:outer membrane receptor protein involved in Fe transport